MATSIPPFSSLLPWIAISPLFPSEGKEEASEETRKEVGRGTSKEIRKREIEEILQSGKKNRQ